MMGLGFEEMIVILVLSILLFDAKQVASALKWLRTTKNKLANLQYDIEQKLEGVIQETVSVTPVAQKNSMDSEQNSNKTEASNSLVNEEQKSNNETPNPEILATQKLREQIKFRISQTPQEELQEASLRLSKKLRNLEFYQNATQIIVYSSLEDEVCTKEIIKNILADKKEVLLPRINTETKIIEFCPISKPDEELRPGKYGILEPLSEIKAVETTHTNLILVPGRVFGIQGQRIGRGKGYYDKFLEKTNQVTRIGIAFESQVITAHIPQFEHDQKMDFILTEKRLISSPRKKKD
jgi:5-formyltetrahydrofolate cyclo-ligase